MTQIANQPRLLLADSTSSDEVVANAVDYPLNPMARRYAVFAATIAVMMQLFDAGGVSVVLRDIQSAFSVSTDEASWTLTVFTICYVIVLPVTTWLGDRLGGRSHFVVAILAYVIASLGCVSADSFLLFLVFRGIQGAAGGTFFARAMLVITRIYPPMLRATPLMLFGTAISLGKALGPWLFGLIAYRWNWRLAFLLNLPLGGLCAAICLAFLPRSRPSRPTIHFDWSGFIVLAAGLACLQAVLSRGEQEDWFSSWRISAMTTVALFALPSFLWMQQRRGNRDPLLRLSVLADWNLAAGLAYGLGLGVNLYAGLYVLPQFLRGNLGNSAETTGKMMMLDGLATAAMVPVAGLLGRRVPRPVLLLSGLTLFAVSMGLLAFHMSTTCSDESLIIPLILRGASLGLQLPTVPALAMRTVNRQLIGEAEDLYLFVRQLGGTIAIAAVTVLVDHRQSMFSARLAERLIPLNPTALHTLAQLQGVFLRRVPAVGDAQMRAYKLLDSIRQGQVTVTAYRDIFLSLSLAGTVQALTLLFSSWHRAMEPSLSTFFVTGVSARPALARELEYG